MMIIELDNSVAGAVAKCHTYAAVRYVLHLAPIKDNPYFKSGQAVHSALEKYFTGESSQNCLEIFDAIYKPWCEKQENLEERLHWGNVRRILEYWFRLHPLESLPWRIFAVEKGFRVHVTDDIYLTGRIDFIGVDRRDNTLVAGDHKTTGRIDLKWRNAIRYGSQLTGYIYALQKIYKDSLVSGGVINGVELRLVPGSTRKCREHGVAYSECGPEHCHFEFFALHRTPEQTQSWFGTFTEMARQFAGLRERVQSVEDLVHVEEQGKFNGLCYNCEFNDFCYYGRTPHFAGTLLKHERWNPLHDVTEVLTA